MNVTTMEPSPALYLLSRRWAPEVLLTLGVEGPCRFNRLLGIQSITHGISDRVLTERLRELEGAGLVMRDVTVERSVTVEYRLTEQGQRYLEPLRALAAIR